MGKVGAEDGRTEGRRLGARPRERGERRVWGSFRNSPIPRDISRSNSDTLVSSRSVLEQVNHNLIDQPLDWCAPKPGVKKPVTQDHHRQTNDLKGSAIKVYRLRDKNGKEKVN